MTEADTQIVAASRLPTCSKEVERFMGLANYHRSFVKNFSQLADQLYSVIGKNKFKLEEKQQHAFDTLKKVLTNPPVLALLNYKDYLIWTRMYLTQLLAQSSCKSKMVWNVLSHMVATLSLKNSGSTAQQGKNC